MKPTTKYVAFDVHQATTVASVLNASGRVLGSSPELCVKVFEQAPRHVHHAA